MLTETWLHSEILDSELGFDNSNIFGLDRNISSSSCVRGGGVAIICVHEKHNAKLISKPVDNVEQLFVSVVADDNNKFILETCYIPPTNPASIYTSHVDTIESLFVRFGNSSQFILSGHYNLPSVKFINYN